MILDALDFKKVVVVDKRRASYIINKLEVSIDEVKGLGTFVEIEIKGGYKSITEGAELIYELAKILKLTELPEDHPVRTGYPHHIYQKEKERVSEESQ